MLPFEPLMGQLIREWEPIFKKNKKIKYHNVCYVFDIDNLSNFIMQNFKVLPLATEIFDFIFVVHPYVSVYLCGKLYCFWVWIKSTKLQNNCASFVQMIYKTWAINNFQKVCIMIRLNNYLKYSCWLLNIIMGLYSSKVCFSWPL